jgi:hypothetical protein
LPAWKTLDFIASQYKTLAGRKGEITLNAELIHEETEENYTFFLRGYGRAATGI